MSWTDEVPKVDGVYWVWNARSNADRKPSDQHYYDKISLLIIDGEPTVQSWGSGIGHRTRASDMPPGFLWWSIPIEAPPSPASELRRRSLRSWAHAPPPRTHASPPTAIALSRDVWKPPLAVADIYSHPAFNEVLEAFHSGVPFSTDIIDRIRCWTGLRHDDSELTDYLLRSVELFNAQKPTKRA